MGYKVREDWLLAAVHQLRLLFKRHGYVVPKGVKVTCGWPGGRSIFATIGQCWPTESSEGGFHEIFITPALSSVIASKGVLATLVHELVHTVVGCKKGHKGPFQSCAKALGLEGRMMSTEAGEDLLRELTTISSTLGPYPHKRLIPTKGAKKQTTRLRKMECGGCGFVVRITQKWIDKLKRQGGMPDCWLCKEKMDIVG